MDVKNILTGLFDRLSGLRVERPTAGLSPHHIIGAIGRAIESCKTLGINIDDHFREVTKMVQLGRGSVRDIQDFMLRCLRKP